MLAACGVSSPEKLFSQIPAEARLKRPLRLAAGISEYEIEAWFKSLAEKNAGGWPSFLGAGVYNHYRPVVVDTVASRGEFLTSYTPYTALTEAALMAMRVTERRRVLVAKSVHPEYREVLRSYVKTRIRRCMRSLMTWIRGRSIWGIWTRNSTIRQRA
jgi:glycine dehydrogenase subunit 1